MTALASGASTGQAVGQAPGIFTISGAEVEPAPSRHHSVTVLDDDETNKEVEPAPSRRPSVTVLNDDEIKIVKVCVLACSLIFGSLPVAMIAVGILDFNLCPGHTRLAIYLIVQGATSVVIPILASIWCCCKCISASFIIPICVIIGLFNIAWGIVGSVWLKSSPCKDTLLFTHALGFSVPMWIFFCVVWIACRLACKKKDD